MKVLFRVVVNTEALTALTAPTNSSERGLSPEMPLVEGSYLAQDHNISVWGHGLLRWELEHP